MGAFVECFIVALRLGLVSFGGPVAHLGYFREEYVVKRRWLDESAFAELLSICHLLPGPTSSQVGAAIGATRGGVAGAVGAWAGFTLPSAVLMGLLGAGGKWIDSGLANVADGLVVAAVAVVTIAVVQMALKLSAGWGKAALTLIAAGVVMLVGGAGIQALAIVGGLLIGALIFPRSGAEEASAVKKTGWTGASAMFLTMLIVSAIAAFLLRDVVPVFAGLYEAGALVFGGGHVVLPLLEQSVVESGYIGREAFVSGYGAAQAMPGPLFTFGAYLGGVEAGALGVIVGTLVIFLPGLLMLGVVLPMRQKLLENAYAPGAIVGAGAVVVGLLLAVLISMFRNGELAQPWQWIAYVMTIVVLWQKWLPVWLVVAVLAGVGAVV